MMLSFLKSGLHGGGSSSSTTSAMTTMMMLSSMVLMVQQVPGVWCDGTYGVYFENRNGPFPNGDGSPAPHSGSTDAKRPERWKRVDRVSICAAHVIV
jgi:hypothetical protein